MIVVADASIVAPALFDDGSVGRLYRGRLRGTQLAAPDLMKVEVCSVIRRVAAAGDIDSARADEAIVNLIDLDVAMYSTSRMVVRVWALRHNLTPYDAVYVALAESLQCSLLTADVRIAGAPGLECAVEVL